MPSSSFMTTDRQVARKFRAAYLMGRVVNGDVCGWRFAKATVGSVIRDPGSVKGRWRITLHEFDPRSPEQAEAQYWEDSIFSKQLALTIVQRITALW
jgi:hypothetical protein